MFCSKFKLLNYHSFNLLVHKTTVKLPKRQGDCMDWESEADIEKRLEKKRKKYRSVYRKAHKKGR
jgi:hypothetical protein